MGPDGGGWKTRQRNFEMNIPSLLHQAFTEWGPCARQGKAGGYKDELKGILSAGISGISALYYFNCGSHGMNEIF